MRTFDLPTIWFRTVQGTELKDYNWEEVAEVLLERRFITLVAPPGADGFTRYKLNHSELGPHKSETKRVILEALREELPRRFGERRTG